MTNKELCKRDLSILNLIFDNSQCEMEVKSVVNDEIEAKDEDERDSSEIIKSKLLEIDGVKLTELGKLEEALNKFNESIKTAEKRPSPYNNRAQLYRLMGKDDCKINFIKKNCLKKSSSVAFDDLTTAIALSQQKYPMTLCRAFCQRGIINRKLRRDDAARDDFNESAKLGSKFARQQLVDINPYAQLCNQMVSKLLVNMK